MRLTSVPALSFLVMSWVRVTVTVIPCFKKDIVTFRLIGVGIAFQDQHCWSPTSARAERKARKLKGAPTGVAFTETKLAFQTYSEP